MISRVTQNNVSFSDSWYGKKIQAYVTAYGLDYEFCRLYSSDKGGMVLVYNSTMTCDGEFDEGELESFIAMSSPVTIEMEKIGCVPEEYKAYRRTLFRCVPQQSDVAASDVKTNTELDTVFKILDEGFDIKEYDAWYADTSHRIRHGISETFLWNSTTVTKLFDIDDFVFLSYIATGKADRGKGRARQLLYYLCSKFEKQGKTVYLFAKDERVSFYEGIGFQPVSCDIFYEKGV